MKQFAAVARPWCAVLGIAATAVSSVMAVHSGWLGAPLAVAVVGTAGPVSGLSS